MDLFLDGEPIEIPADRTETELELDCKKDGETAAYACAPRIQVKRTGVAGGFVRGFDHAQFAVGMRPASSLSEAFFSFATQLGRNR